MGHNLLKLCIHNQLGIRAVGSRHVFFWDESLVKTSSCACYQNWIGWKKSYFGGCSNLWFQSNANLINVCINNKPTKKISNWLSFKIPNSGSNSYVYDSNQHRKSIHKPTPTELLKFNFISLSFRPYFLVVIHKSIGMIIVQSGKREI